MRFYDIQITDENGDIVSIGTFKMHFTSFRAGFLGGVTIPGALNIEMDIPVYDAATPTGDAYIKIWGIDLNTVNNASTLTYKNITISAGMKKGLPLASLQANANPSRNGVIFKGSILQAFGNWQGGEQTIDLIVTTRMSSNSGDVTTLNYIVFDCAPNSSIASAITKSLADVGITCTVNIDTRLVASDRIVFQARDIREFAERIEIESTRIIKDSGYLGAKFTKTDTGYLCADNTVDKEPISIEFTDLIGQPTWIDYATVQLKCVMRSDIKVMDKILLPEKNDLNTKKSYAFLKNSIAFRGGAWVKSIRHIGNYRQSDANSWVSVIEVVPT